MADPDFLAEGKRVRLRVEPIGHAEIERLIDRLYAMPRETIARAKKLLAKKKKKKKSKK